MSIVINPDQLIAAYNFVLTLEPFNLWAYNENRKEFPHTDEIEFSIIGDKRFWAFKGRKQNGTLLLAYSNKAPTQASHLVMYMSHEMIHLYQDINGLENKSIHNADFRHRAAQVCQIHGYDLRLYL